MYKGMQVYTRGCDRVEPTEAKVGRVYSVGTNIQIEVPGISFCGKLTKLEKQPTSRNGFPDRWILEFDGNIHVVYQNDSRMTMYRALLKNDDGEWVCLDDAVSL